MKTPEHAAFFIKRPASLPGSATVCLCAQPRCRCRRVHVCGTRMCLYLCVLRDEEEKENNTEGRVVLAWMPHVCPQMPSNSDSISVPKRTCFEWTQAACSS